MTTLLLAGGGHAHVEVLRRFALSPAPGVDLVLVSPDRLTPYSGMLPGLVAGHYAHDEAHIDLAPLAASARARFRRARVVALDPVAGRATLDDGPAIDFDHASLDVGSTPDLSMPGAASHAVGVKPVERFLAAWEALKRDAAAGGVRRVAVVGGGAGGVEVLLAMRYRLAADLGPRAPAFVLVSDRSNLPPAANRALLAAIAAAGIDARLGQRAVAFETDGVRLADGARVDADRIFCATPATAAPWLAASGLATDARGFVSVDEHLRSPSHPRIFAAGDCATQLGTSHPRSGVYAVRQGPPLAANLRAVALGEPLERYVPQKRALALLSTGDRHAIAVWGGWSVAGRWVWRWKDRIDRRFMARYRVDGDDAAAGARMQE